MLQKTTSTDRTWLAVLLCAGFALRLVILTGYTTIETDGTFYATIAERITAGLFGEALSNVFSPMYPVFIALFHLIIPDLELAARLTSLFFGTLVIYMTYVFAGRLLKSQTKALWVAFLVAFHPFLVRYSGQALSESLATFLFTLTTFLFYAAWQEEKRTALAVSGFCLALTYLTRPEYLAYFGPFALVLLLKKRVTDIVIFLGPFLVLGVLYILYLHARTGLWMVSNKATLSPFVGLGDVIGNVPFVAYEFLIAISPLFFVLAVLGFRRVKTQYRGLAVFLVVVHILSLSFVSHATKRYSVEFAPMVIIFAVEGVIFLDGYFAQVFRKRLALFVIALFVVSVGIWQSYTPPRFDRTLHKKAGLFLLHRAPGSIIASRIPAAAFYAKGTYVSIVREMEEDGSMEQLRRTIAEKKVQYLVVDDVVARDLPVVNDYLLGAKPLEEFTYRESFVRVFAVDADRERK